MADDASNGIDALFSRAPQLGDDEIFAAEIVRKLEQYERARRWLVGGSVVLGGVVGAAQILSWYASGEAAAMTGRWVVRAYESVPAYAYASSTPNGVMAWMAAILLIGLVGYMASASARQI